MLGIGWVLFSALGSCFGLWDLTWVGLGWVKSRLGFDLTHSYLTWFFVSQGMPEIYLACWCIILAIFYQLWLYFRLLWFILFGFAVWYGYLLYTPFLDAWFYEPTVIATDQADFPVEKLPFPAITICSNNKIVYRQLESVLRTQPWKGLISSNWNITQATNNGRLNNNL